MQLYLATLLLSATTILALPQGNPAGPSFGEPGGLCTQDSDCGTFNPSCRVASLPLLGGNGDFIPTSPGANTGLAEPPALRCVGSFGPNTVCGSILDCSNFNCGCTSADGKLVCCPDNVTVGTNLVLSSGANGNGA